MEGHEDNEISIKSARMYIKRESLDRIEMHDTRKSMYGKVQYWVVNTRSSATIIKSGFLYRNARNDSVQHFCHIFTLSIAIPRSFGSVGQVLYQSSWVLAKSYIAWLDSSSHGLSPTLSGNHPLVPPTATLRMR